MQNPFTTASGLETGPKLRMATESLRGEGPAETPSPIEQLPAIRKGNQLAAQMDLLQKDLTPAQVEKLDIWHVKQDLGMSIAQGPLVCRDACLHAEVCPLHQANIHPVSKRCPVEGTLMLKWKQKWAESLGMDLDDSDNDAFDLKLLDDLAGISMLKNRAYNEMAISSPDIAEKFVGGYVDDMPIEKVMLNPRVTLIEKLIKLELKIYSELLTTRKAKFQVSGRLDDLSKRQAELADKMREVRAREIAKAEAADDIMDADFEVKD